MTKKWFWTKETVLLASKMWNEGAALQEIAERTERTREAVLGLSFRKRKLFPKRKLEPLHEAVCVKESTLKEQEPKAPIIRLSEGIRRVTVKGITMPYVPSIHQGLEVR